MVPSQFLSVVLEEDNGSGSEEDTHAYSQRSKWWECDPSQVQLVQARVKMVHDNYYFIIFKTSGFKNGEQYEVECYERGCLMRRCEMYHLLASKVDY